MGRATNANAMSSVGSFSTARRGGLPMEIVRQIEAHRAKERPTPRQALAKRYAVAEVTLRQMFEALEPTPQPAEDPTDVRLRDLWTRGVRSDDICSELGISRSTLWNMRCRLKLPARQVHQRAA